MHGDVDELSEAQKAILTEMRIIVDQDLLVHTTGDDMNDSEWAAPATVGPEYVPWALSM